MTVHNTMPGHRVRSGYPFSPMRLRQAPHRAFLLPPFQNFVLISQYKFESAQLLIDILVPGLEDFPSLFQVIGPAVRPDHGIVFDMREAGLRDCEVNAMLGHPGAAH